MEARRLAVLFALALGPAACAGGCDDDRAPRGVWDEPLPSDPIARAIALRDRVPTGVPTWPDGTTMLAEDRAFDVVALRGDDLFGAAGEELVRLPKAGGAATTLARFPGREARAIGLTAKHVVVATHERDPEGVGVKDGTGKLVAVPLDGGAPVELLSGFGASTEMTAVDDGVYFAREATGPGEILFFAAAGPAFKKAKLLSQRAHVMFWSLIPESDGADWVEEDFSTDRKAVMGWTRAGDAGATREIARAAGFGLRSDGHTLYMVTTSSTSAVAPGGGQYFEDTGSVVAIDRATGAERTLAAGLANPGDVAVGPDVLCVPVYGPKLEFSKNSAVLAVPKSGGEPTRVATGLQRPSCLAADAQSFFVKVQGKKGIARVPVKRP